MNSYHKPDVRRNQQNSLSWRCGLQRMLNSAQKVSLGSFPLAYQIFSSESRKFWGFCLFSLACARPLCAGQRLTPRAAGSRASAGTRATESQPPGPTGSHGQRSPAAERRQKRTENTFLKMNVKILVLFIRN